MGSLALTQKDYFVCSAFLYASDELVGGCVDCELVTCLASSIFWKSICCYCYATV